MNMNTNVNMNMLLTSHSFAEPHNHITAKIVINNEDGSTGMVSLGALDLVWM